MKKLTLEIIKKYNLEMSTFKPDWDDAGYKVKLPSGIELETLFMCNGEPCESDCLEGMDGYIYIDTEEELIKFISMSFEDIIKEIKVKNPEFDESEYL